MRICALTSRDGLLHPAHESSPPQRQSPRRGDLVFRQPAWPGQVRSHRHRAGVDLLSAALSVDGSAPSYWLWCGLPIAPADHNSLRPRQFEILSALGVIAMLSAGRRLPGRAGPAERGRAAVRPAAIRCRAVTISSCFLARPRAVAPPRSPSQRSPPMRCIASAAVLDRRHIGLGRSALGYVWGDRRPPRSVR